MIIAQIDSVMKQREEEFRINFFLVIKQKSSLWHHLRSLPFISPKILAEILKFSHQLLKCLSPYLGEKKCQLQTENFSTYPGHQMSLRNDVFFLAVTGILEASFKWIIKLQIAGKCKIYFELCYFHSSNHCLCRYVLETLWDSSKLCLKRDK